MIIKTVWENILWTDDTKVKYSYIWHKANIAFHEKNIPTFKHGGGSV